MARGIDLHADVLKVGHHGSAYATSSEFIAAVQPRFALISVGRQNLFGHPARSTISIIEATGAKVYRTDMCGAITLSITNSLNLGTMRACDTHNGWRSLQVGCSHSALRLLRQRIVVESRNLLPHRFGAQNSPGLPMYGDREAAFLWYGAHHLLPDLFVSDVAYGDIIVGLLGPLVVVLPESSIKYFIFHAVSMSDFVLAVGTGLTLTVLDVPLMENLTTFPVVLISVFGVGVTGAISIMTRDRLVRSRAEQAASVGRREGHASVAGARS